MTPLVVGTPPHSARNNIIRCIIINNLCLLTLSQQVWELILGILIIFWIADSYIAINTLLIYINKLNTLTLIYDTDIKNKKNNYFKIILKVQ
jgi:hypothetical protein